MNKKIRTQKDDHLFELVMSGFLRGAVDAGKITIKGKTVEEIRLDLAEYIDKYVMRKRGDIPMVIDHTPSLLDQAKKFRRTGSIELSCILFATWIEHWINQVIRNQAVRTKIPETHIVSAIKETQLRGKITWLPIMLGLPPLGKAWQ